MTPEEHGDGAGKDEGVRAEEWIIAGFHRIKRKKIWFLAAKVSGKKQTHLNHLRAYVG